MVTISILWCEFGYHYFVIYYNCSAWPGSDGFKHDQGITKLLVIADTHIMGPIKSVKIDKLRREWQMKQAFWISKSILKPDVIVFMGDILDEGSFSHDQYFKEACDDFDYTFPRDDDEERIIIPGNHDVGFHDHMINFPFLMRRFQERFITTSSIKLIETPKIKHLNIVVSNSMSFYNDTCPFCSITMEALNQLKLNLDHRRKVDPEQHASPILLGHIPLYRKNDLNCAYPASLSNKVKMDNVEGKEVLHKISTSALVTRLKPRLAISGHTHMLCITDHPTNVEASETFEEITVSSYNHKYAEMRPGFLLLTASSSQVFTKYCDLIEEWIVVSIYCTTLLVILIRFILARAGC